ncbi:MAG: hypothetical protein IPJ24_01290 [bacterium]|nr:hypothetical protein [bacterium]
MNNKICLSGSPLRRAPQFALLVLIVTGLTACGGNDNKTQAQQSAAAQPAAQSQPSMQQPAAQPAEGGMAGRQAILAAVAFTPPAGWQDLGPTNMRQAQYRLAPIGGDTAPAEVNVFYFGAESGGGVDANLQRWVNQMVMPDGSDPSATAKRTSFSADGMPGHIITLEGTYKSGGGPMMGGETKMLEGYRLVGVVLEGPQGSLFFKLTGPVATAKVMEADLMKMMEGARKAG